MKLSYAKAVSREFSKNLFEKRDGLGIEDIILYGSVAKEKSFPKDIDLMMIHNNPRFDEFAKISKDRDIPDLKKAEIFNQIFEDYIDIFESLKGSGCIKMLEKGLLNVNYMNTSYFADSNYRDWWNELNIWDKNFLNNLESHSKLWNPETKDYDIPVKDKYIFSELTEA